MSGALQDLSLRLNVGISTVGWAEGPSRLPDEGAVPAADTRPALRLDAMYEATTLDDRLLAATVPMLADRSVLSPTIYAAALQDAHACLTDLAARASGEAHDILQAAVTVLDNAADTRQLLDAASRALMLA